MLVYDLLSREYSHQQIQASYSVSNLKQIVLMNESVEQSRPIERIRKQISRQWHSKSSAHRKNERNNTGHLSAAHGLSDDNSPEAKTSEHPSSQGQNLVEALRRCLEENFPVSSSQYLVL